MAIIGNEGAPQPRNRLLGKGWISQRTREQEKHERCAQPPAPQGFLGSDMWEGRVQSQALSMGEREGTSPQGGDQE